MTTIDSTPATSASASTGAPSLTGTSARDQRAAGRSRRQAVSRAAQGIFDAEPGRNPIATLSAQNTDRIPELVPIRRERMSESPFAFYRGAAAVMAADLAGTAVTGLEVQLCGDAHLSNFGLFASRDRQLVFDVNDFDETNPGPWEWDLKRLVTSVVILGQAHGLTHDEVRGAAETTAAAYRMALKRFAAMSATNRFFTMTRAKDLVTAARADGAGKDTIRKLRQLGHKAQKNTSERVLGKLTVRSGDGSLRIIDQPPLTLRVAELNAGDAGDLAAEYLMGVSEDVAELFRQFRFQDGVVKVVGVGSVGTRCLLVLFTDAEEGPLFLQIKEATTSVLEPFTRPSTWPTSGRRVVAGQRIMQSTGDPFLGHFTAANGRHYYVRQYRDMKGSIDPADLTTARSLTSYTRLCAQALARAHAQSGIAAAISGYLGTAQHADRAFADFGLAYAAQNQADYEALLGATDDEWAGKPAT